MDRPGGIPLSQRHPGFYNEPTCSTLTSRTLSLRPGTRVLRWRWSNITDPLVPLQNDNYRNQRILFAGVDWERKGGPDLVAAFKIVQQRLPHARLTIVGCSPQLELRNCDIVGWVPLEQMKNYYAQASVFCLPTLLEPFGIVFVELLLNKIPIVATNLGALPDIVENGKSGYLVEPNNSVELARALCELLSDAGKCSRFGSCGYQAVVERYSWNSTGKRIRQEILAGMRETLLQG